MREVLGGGDVWFCFLIWVLVSPMRSFRRNISSPTCLGPSSCRRVLPELKPRISKQGIPHPPPGPGLVPEARVFDSFGGLGRLILQVGGHL